MPATYEPIASQTLSSNTATVTFSDIPGTYTDLVLVTALRTSLAGARSDDVSIRFNSDTGSNYSRTYLYGNGSSALSGRDSNSTLLPWSYCPAATAGSNQFSVDVLQIMSYSNTNVFKTCLSLTSDAGVLAQRQVGLWRSTAAITSLTIGQFGTSNMVSGSTFSLYGIKAA